MQNRKCQTPHTIFPLVHTQTSQFVDIEILGTKYDEMEGIDFCPYSPSPEEKAFFEAVRSGNSAEVEELINVKHVDVDCTNVNGETALQIAGKRLIWFKRCYGIKQTSGQPCSNSGELRNGAVQMWRGVICFSRDFTFRINILNSISTPQKHSFFIITNVLSLSRDLPHPFLTFYFNPNLHHFINNTCNLIHFLSMTIDTKFMELIEVILN